MREPSTSIPAFEAVPPALLRRRHPYVQIARATVTRPWLWFWPVALTVLLALANIPFSRGDAGGSELWIAICLALSTSVLAGAVVHHFGELAAPPRGHAVPGLQSRACVVGIIALLLCLILPGALWPLPHMTGEYTPTGEVRVVQASAPHRLPYFAFAALVAACVGWASRFRNLSLVLVLLAATLSIEKVNQRMYLMFYGLQPGLMYGLLGTAAALFVVLWRDVATRRDEPAFDLVVWQWFARMFRRDVDARPASPAGIPALRPAPTFVRLLRARRRVTNAGVPATLAGGLCGGLFSLWLYGLQLAGFGPLVEASVPIAIVIVSALSGTVVASRAFAAQRPLLAYDLMLPARRDAFFRLTGLAYLVDLLVLWGAGQLAMFLVFGVFDAAVVIGAWRRFWVHLPVALAYLLFFFGVFVWMLRARSRVAAMIVTYAVCVVCPAVLFPVLYANRVVDYSVALVVAAPLAAAGAAMTATAYRRWSIGALPVG